MYMGVILLLAANLQSVGGAPHVYGGDPINHETNLRDLLVLPMYMGVILAVISQSPSISSAPHVYGGDPSICAHKSITFLCSPCIWG